MTILHGRALCAAALVALFLGAPAMAAPVPTPPTDEALKEKAIKLNDATKNLKSGDEADSKKLQESLTDLLKDKVATKRLVVIAAKMLAEKDSPFKFNGAFVLGKAAQNVKDYKSAEAFYKFCKSNATKSEKGADLARAYDGLIDLYWDQKKFAEVEELCAELLNSEDTGKEMGSAKSFAIERMIQSKARRGDHDEALNMADAVIKLEKGGWYSLQLKGYVLREAGKIDQAIDTYTDVLKKLEADKKLEAEEKTKITRNVRYMLTGLHVENKDIDKAADILKALVKEVPDSATYKNDLGFIWADNDLKLEESEKLIREALDLDQKAREKARKEGKIDAEDAKKANAAYQDSLGWVLYKNKKYDEAIKLLTEASLDEEEGQHMEI